MKSVKVVCQTQSEAPVDVECSRNVLMSMRKVWRRGGSEGQGLWIYRVHRHTHRLGGSSFCPRELGHRKKTMLLTGQICKCASSERYTVCLSNQRFRLNYFFSKRSFH